MFKYVFVILILFVSSTVNGQIEAPFCGSFFSGAHTTIKKDSLGTFYKIGDSSKYIVYISENWRVYRLFDLSERLLAEGDLGGRIYADYFKRFGKWTEYYENGKMKATGDYYEDNPVGLWVLYYSNGHKKEVYNIGVFHFENHDSYCKTGHYYSYYETGRLKCEGFYKGMVDSGYIQIEDPVTGEMESSKIAEVRPERAATWIYYKPTGEIEKKEELDR